MRFTFLFWLILFVLGALVGDRYGVPGWASNFAERGFTAAEQWTGKLGKPIPAAEETDDTPAPTQEPAQDQGKQSTPAPQPSSAELGNAANAGLKINDAGLQIIKDSEGLRLEAYNLGGQWLIGYGHAGTAKAGMTISQAQAEQLLRQDVRNSEDAVRRMVLTPINENQFSAMVSLAYNMGSGGFSRTVVLERINQGKVKSAADGFLQHNKAGGKANVHLTERRGKERTLFLSPA